jgi:hypothetical protein
LKNGLWGFGFPPLDGGFFIIRYYPPSSEKAQLENKKDAGNGV